MVREQYHIAKTQLPIIDRLSLSFGIKKYLLGIKIFGIIILLAWINSTSIAQTATKPPFSISSSDTIINSRVQSLNQIQLKKELEITESKLQEARSEKAVSEEAVLLYKIAIIYKQLRMSEESLKYLLWAIKAFEKAQEANNVLEVKRDLGNHYYDSRAYQKAVQYYLLYLKGKQRLNQEVSNLTDILHKIAQSYFILEEYEEAEDTYLQLVKLYKAQGDITATIAAYEALANINKQVNNIDGAIQYLEQVQKISQQQRDTLKLLQTLNNLGFLQKRNNNLKGAIVYFQKALELPENIIEDPDMRVSMLTNLGVAYTNLGFFSRAKEVYNEALDIREKSGDIVGQANLLNYLASNAYISQNNAQALKMADKAIKLAVTKNANEELVESYKLVALIYQEEKDTEKAEIYQQSYQDIRGRINAKRKAERQKLLTIQERIDAKEEYIKSLIVEQEQLNLERERQENALKLKEKELILLRKSQALQEAELLNQELAKERAEQQLAIAQQELLAEKQKRELLELQRLQERQTLELEQNQSEQEKQEKAIALLEAERRLQQQKLKQEATLRKYGYGIITSFLAIIGVVSYSFIQKRQDNQKLQEQQVKIQEQNAYLKASEQMLMTSVNKLEITQKALEKQKEKLEIENYKTQESLQYAKRIQFSILPSERESKKIFPESFVIFRPKDVVSGDFYWMSEHGNRRIVSVVDCTGHGVPGALVSLIAYNMMNEAIREKKLLDPVAILDYLNQQVKKRLRGNDNSIQDGMDIGICALDINPDKTVRLRYAGAKHTLYAVHQGSLEVIKGVRRTVGSIQKNIFELEQQLDLGLGDALYLTTDGFIDQSNSERKRFGSRQLKELIQEWHSLPIMEQQARFTEALENHQQSTEQRDDINLIGIKV
jgi:serine phosphatase RsbU (regulator of sigma subunit)/tetratricopeptide (TPR) repeat protein